jgi:hypothetical protein
MPPNSWKTHRILGVEVGLLSWLGMLCPVWLKRLLNLCLANRYTNRHNTMMNPSATTRSGFFTKT